MVEFLIFSTFNISSTAFWCLWFVRRNWLILRIFSNNKLLFSSCFQVSLFALVFWQFDFNLSYRSLWLYSSWSSLSFLDLWINAFHQIVEVFVHYSFKYSSFSVLSLAFPSWTSIMHMLVSLMVSHRSLWLCLFFPDSFYFYASDQIISAYLSSGPLILLCAYWNLFLKSSSEFFILVNVRLAPKFLFGF